MPALTRLHLAGACLNQTPLDWPGNLARIEAAIAQAKEAGVQLLCLPELCLTGYGCEDAFFTRSVQDYAWNLLDHLLPLTAGLVVTVGLPVHYESSLFNCVAVLANTELVGLTAKQALAGDGVHYEPRWFKPWPDGRIDTFRRGPYSVPIGDVLYEIDGIRFGFEICEDAWNGVRPATDHYRNAVDIILNPSASHFAFGKHAIRRTLVEDSSRAFACSYVYANLLGNEAGRLVYDGEVLIAHNGRLINQNKRFQFQDIDLVHAVVDVLPTRRERTRRFAFLSGFPETVVRTEGVWEPTPEAITPPLQRTQPHYPTQEEETYQALTLGLFDYLRKSRSTGFVVSLSGGADSAMCAVLATHALDRAQAELAPNDLADKLGYLGADLETPLAPQLIWTVYQGTENSSPQTRESAQKLAEDLGVRFTSWEVDELVAGYRQRTEAALNRQLNWGTDDLALQNIQARVRAPGVWMLANVTGGLLLTTGNRSEIAVGYSTMDGDSAGGLAPIGGLDKDAVLRWLTWAEASLPVSGLRFVNALQPSAELRPPSAQQRDEDDLMPYAVLDRIERQAIHLGNGPLETFQRLEGLVPHPELHRYVKRFFQLWARNQWKRERYAPSFHLDDANLDPRTWCRFPILSGGYAAELEALDRYVASLPGA